MSKGSKRRPCYVAELELARRWGLAFGTVVNYSHQGSKPQKFKVWTEKVKRGKRSKRNAG